MLTPPTAAAVVVADTAVSDSGARTSWLLVALLAVAGALLVVVLAPARPAGPGGVGRKVVGARVVLAAVALGILLGVVVPLMTQGLG